MLGEDHSLLVDFADHRETILGLSSKDKAFLDEAHRYDALDKEIRELELNNSPLDDEEMHKLKTKRAAMKDDLFQKIMAAS